MAVLTSLAVDTPIPVRQLNPNVPVALEQLIHRLLAKDRDQRPSSAEEVVKALAFDKPINSGTPEFVSAMPGPASGKIIPSPKSMRRQLKSETRNRHAARGNK